MRTSDQDLFFFVQALLLRRLTKLHSLQRDTAELINRHGPEDMYTSSMVLYKKQFASCLRWLQDLKYEPWTNPKHRVRIVVGDLYDIVHQALEESIERGPQRIDELTLSGLVLSRDAATRIIEPTISRYKSWLQLISR